MNKKFIKIPIKKSHYAKPHPNRLSVLVAFMHTMTSQGRIEMKDKTLNQIKNILRENKKRNNLMLQIVKKIESNPNNTELCLKEIDRLKVEILLYNN